jgi:hypothetical protein
MTPVIKTFFLSTLREITKNPVSAGCLEAVFRRAFIPRAFIDVCFIEIDEFGRWADDGGAAAPERAER